jgi:hypothetical protein
VRHWLAWGILAFAANAAAGARLGSLEASPPPAALRVARVAARQAPEARAPKADPAVKLPAEVKGEPGDFVTVRAETDGKVVRWYAVDPGLKLFPVELLKDTRTAVVVGRVPGKYRLLAYTAAGDVPSEPAVVVILIEGPSPGPAPGPGPTPPGPGPSDPLAQALAAAWAQEPPATRAGHRDTLAALYRQGADTARQENLKTVGELLAVLKSASAALLPADALPAVRKAVSEHLRAKLPTDAAAPLDPATRELCAGEFRKVAAVLEGLR